MSVSIDIVPLAESLDMYGKPDKSSAFSLSGHVSIAITSPHSVFERRRPARIILQSVLLTFDGQTEVITTKLGYTPLRLCTITRELAPAQTVELSNEGHEDTDEPCRWNVVFDLPIPGWLPASHEFSPGDVGASTKYFLYAQVKFIVLEDHRNTAWSFTTLCSPFRSRARTLDAYKSITLRRFLDPPTDEPAPPTLVNYLLSPPRQSFSQRSLIPWEILSKIQVMASVPQHADVCEDHLPFTLRLRTKDLDDADSKRLQMISFAVDIVQEETCRRVSKISAVDSRYPVAPEDTQPPNCPLFDTHHASDMYLLGLYLPRTSTATTMSVSTSLLLTGEPVVHHLSGDNHIFGEDAVKGAETWYTMETSIPYIRALPVHLDQMADWEGALRLRPSTAGPLYDVTHAVKLSVRCTYDMPGTDEIATAELVFSIPVTFGRIAPPLPSRDILPALFHAARLPDGAYPPLPALLPHANLPVYSQLFDSQGNRKMDATPLPLYTPRSSMDSAAEVVVDVPPADEKHDHDDSELIPL